MRNNNSQDYFCAVELFVDNELSLPDRKGFVAVVCRKQWFIYFFVAVIALTPASLDSSDARRVDGISRDSSFASDRIESELVPTHDHGPPEGLLMKDGLRFLGQLDGFASDPELAPPGRVHLLFGFDDVHARCRQELLYILVCPSFAKQTRNEQDLAEFTLQVKILRFEHD